MEYTIYSETLVNYIIRDRRTQRYIHFTDGKLNSTNTMFEATLFRSIKEVENMVHFLNNEYSLKDLEIRKIKVIDIGEQEIENN